jgi:hypothetical protein
MMTPAINDFIEFEFLYSGFFAPPRPLSNPDDLFFIEFLPASFRVLLCLFYRKLTPVVFGILGGRSNILTLLQVLATQRLLEWI